MVNKIKACIIIFNYYLIIHFFIKFNDKNFKETIVSICIKMISPLNFKILINIFL
jgi:hypothetical protein